jgi:hypothetical protein
MRQDTSRSVTSTANVKALMWLICDQVTVGMRPREKKDRNKQNPATHNMKSQLKSKEKSELKKNVGCG